MLLHNSVFIERKNSFFDSSDEVEKSERLCIFWGCSSVGRAPALQAGCQEFESPQLHHFIGLVAQLVRARA